MCAHSRRWQARARVRIFSTCPNTLMCPHTTYLSACYICVLMLLLCVRILCVCVRILHVFSYSYILVRIQDMCSDTRVYWWWGGLKLLVYEALSY
jgi:hypothetical protein